MEKTQKENIYIGILAQCLDEINRINDKLSFVQCDGLQGEKTSGNPIRTELESISFEILNQLKKLNSSIVI